MGTGLNVLRVQEFTKIKKGSIRAFELFIYRRNKKLLLISFQERFLLSFAKQKPKLQK